MQPESQPPLWGRFGEDDRLGTLNLIDPAKVLEAVACVRTGEVISLNAPIDEETANPMRPPYRRTPFMRNTLRPYPDPPSGTYGVANDDAVEFSLQGSSHWDAFSHFGLIEPGVDGIFYNGAGLDETAPDFTSKTLGIDAFAGGIVTRGVVLDLVSAVHGGEHSYLDDSVDVGLEHIEGCLDAQGVELRRGDLVMLYTGFEARKAAGARGSRDPGIDKTTVDLWIKSEISALASDNAAVESWPSKLEVHIATLRNAGLPLGELWALEELMKACRADGVYDCLVTSAPLNIRGAFGSPANALAIR